MFNSDFYVKFMEFRTTFNKRELRFQFDRKVNFLIGRNGVGKTTIINMIHGGMSVDINKLFKVPFERFSLLIGNYDASHPDIVINVVKYDRLNEIYLDFNISGNAIFCTHTFSQGEIRSISEQPTIAIPWLIDPPIKDSRIKELQSLIKDKLGITWLSVNRGEGHFSGLSREINPVNHRLSDVCARLSAYRATIRNQEAAESTDFQKKLLTALIFRAEAEAEGIFGRGKHNRNFKESDDINQYKMDMISMFDSMSVPKDFYEMHLDSLFNKIEEAEMYFKAKKSRNNNKSTETDIMQYHFTMYEYNRLLIILSAWKEQKYKIEKIKETIDRFQIIISGMLSNKIIIFDDQNQPIVKTSENKIIPINDLSSGEKQMFILLSEATLQQGRSFLYIADEPELSLHMEWQSSLVQNISTLNPSSQLIFATHSPDIVSKYKSNVIQLGGI